MNLVPHVYYISGHQDIQLDTTHWKVGRIVEGQDQKIRSAKVIVEPNIQIS